LISHFSEIQSAFYCFYWIIFINVTFLFPDLFCQGQLLCRMVGERTTVSTRLPMEFINRDIHTQTVENFWMRAKRKLRRQFGTSRQLFPSYQHAFLWRNRHRFLNIFSNFKISISQQYPV
jgi:hypothetical protein